MSKVSYMVRWSLSLVLSSLTAGCGSGQIIDGTEATTDGGSGSYVSDPLRQCMMNLGRLTVVGNQLLVNCGGQMVPTRLKGINRSGLQHKIGLNMAGFGSDPSM